MSTYSSVQSRFRSAYWFLSQSNQYLKNCLFHINSKLICLKYFDSICFKNNFVLIESGNRPSKKALLLICLICHLDPNRTSKMSILFINHLGIIVSNRERYRIFQREKDKTFSCFNILYLICFVKQQSKVIKLQYYQVRTFYSCL